jgi:DNA-binding NarL/FixJ family response regulator
MVLALVRDLIFASRITATAAELGVPVKLMRDPAALPGQTGRRLIVDLNLDGAIEAARAWQATVAGGDVVGFVSHVDKATIDRARAAGVDQVLARSRFVEVLPDLLLAAGSLGGVTPAHAPASEVGNSERDQEL